ncbi:MAG TPA: WXG100 family type VII secretion target [Trebonia sp.]|jgi:WXG100 family type VII secretion target|nr:WXG100 family type VII secretion target [Trebonia sp.]
MATSDTSAVPAGREFSVTPEYVQTAASSVNTTAENIAEQLSALKSYVVSLEGQWQGIAASTFTALMADYDIYSQMLNQALTGIASGLQGTYVNYSESEQQNVTNLQAVGGAIPGGNFT